MRPVVQRVRAEVTSDFDTFVARAEELAALPRFAADPAPLAQAAVALHHAYGAVESALIRIARLLEGEAPTGPDWHQALLASMALEIESIRPPVLSPETLADLRMLLSFRHFFRHAYSVQLDPERLEELRSVAIRLRTSLRADFARLDDLLRELAST